MAIQLFLDSNIFLSFYALSNADISQLNKLHGVVHSGDVRLIVSDQIANEVQRNRDNKVQESFKALRDNNFKCQAPSFVRSMEDYDKLQEILSEANKQHSELIKSATQLIESRELDADKVVQKLFEVAKVDATTDKQFLTAYKRFLRGNPPGKKKVTIGDELNWEFLLENVPNGEDLHLVSQDGDYASPNDPRKLDVFLSSEWKSRKGSELHFYRELNEFFKLYIPKIELANQARLDTLIAELAGSLNFASTHNTIARFPENPQFNDAQVQALMDIKSNNSKVGWIEEDPDVAAFYAPIKKRFAEIVASMVAQAPGSNAGS